jgi:hypothetical protein
MRETIGPNEAADLQRTYDELLDLGLRIQTEYHENYDDIHPAWEAVINDLMLRRANLLRSIEPGLNKRVDIAEAVHGVAEAFAGLSSRPMSERQVSDASVSRSLQALLPVASECGYDATVVDNKLSLRKGDVEIQIGFMARPGEVGLGPRAAVQYLEGHAGGKFLVQYNGNWEGVTSDKELQHEVDRAVAIFG